MGVVAISMAGMMLPTAVPFFVSLRRPGRIAVAGGIYLAVWALVGAASFLAMAGLMLPSYATIAAVAIAALYLLSPWARAARARCKELCLRPATDPLQAGLSYTGNCMLASAGVMAAVMVLGMSDVAVLAAGAVTLLVYKLI